MRALLRTGTDGSNKIIFRVLENIAALVPWRRRLGMLTRVAVIVSPEIPRRAVTLASRPVKLGSGCPVAAYHSTSSSIL